jgi:hypothetical protein
MVDRGSDRIARIQARIDELREQLRHAKVTDREQRQRELLSLIRRAGIADEVRLLARRRLDQEGGNREAE